MPQLAQNLPVFFVPHSAQVHSAAGAGAGFPQLAQNLPVFPPVPHSAHFQPAGWGAGAGAGAGACWGICCCCWPAIPYRLDAFIPPAAPAIFIPINPNAAPIPPSLPAAVRIASDCASTRTPAPIAGFDMAMPIWIFWIFASSSSLALTLFTPKETIARPRSSVHFLESTSFRASAISNVCPARSV